jgi:hypothetical protein
MEFKLEDDREDDHEVKHYYDHNTITLSLKIIRKMMEKKND